LTGLDESALTNGKHVDLALPLSDGGFAPCDDFFEDALGAAPTGWNQLVGTWNVVQVANGHAMAQVGAPANVLAVISEGEPGWRNLVVTASVETGGTTDCVLARLQNASNYYAFCLVDGTSWALQANVGGVLTTLDSGPYDPGSNRYDLELRVIATQLVGSVNGMQIVTHSDSQLDHGALGVGTRAFSDFPKVCVTLL
jgi:hypothetical protein